MLYFSVLWMLKHSTQWRPSICGDRLLRPLLRPSLMFSPNFFLAKCVFYIWQGLRCCRELTAICQEKSEGNIFPVDKKWLQGRFDRVLPTWSWEMPVERELLAKIGRCWNRRYGHNFQNSALSLNQRYFVYIKIPLIQFQGWNMKIVAVRFCDTPF